MTVGWGDDFIAPPFTECSRNNIYTLGYCFMSLILSTALSHYVGVFPVTYSRFTLHRFNIKN